MSGTSFLDELNIRGADLGAWIDSDWICRYPGFLPLPSSVGLPDAGHEWVMIYESIDLLKPETPKTIKYQKHVKSRSGG